MDPLMIKNISSALAIMVGVIFPAIAIGQIGKAAMHGIARNPEAASNIRTSMILSIAFAEAIAIYVLIVSLIIKFF